MTGHTLLLTATVTPPPDAHSISRVSPEVRMNDYLWALEFYLKLPDDVIRRVVFVENSNSDITKLRELAGKYPGKEVEFLSFYGLDYPSLYGRGYGEFKLLDHAIEHSEALAKLGPEDLIWKGTGRLRLLNIKSLIRSAPAKYDLYFDLRNLPEPWMDLRFFSFTMAGYRRYLMGMYHKVRQDVENTSAEICVRRAISDKLDDPMIVPRFRRQPHVDGVQGWLNASYSRGPRNRAKHLFRVVMRRVAPNVWM